MRLWVARKNFLGSFKTWPRYVNASARSYLSTEISGKLIQRMVEILQPETWATRDFLVYFFFRECENPIFLWFFGNYLTSVFAKDTDQSHLFRDEKFFWDFKSLQTKKSRTTKFLKFTLIPNMLVFDERCGRKKLFSKHIFFKEGVMYFTVQSGSELNFYSLWSKK